MTPGGPFGTALQGASFDNHLKIVQFLVDKGADVNASGKCNMKLIVIHYNLKSQGGNTAQHSMLHLSRIILKLQNFF
jgi:ankyrin repeat protein